MADVGVEYVLSTGAGTITFNDGVDPYAGANMFYITEISGLGGPPVRAPLDLVPLGDGGIIHDFWKGPRHIGVEGVLFIPPGIQGDDIVQARNDMEDDLINALESILRADGTLDWAPIGQGTRSLTVRYEQQLEFRHQDNYLLEAFTFGLVAANPDWSGSS